MDKIEIGSLHRTNFGLIKITESKIDYENDGSSYQLGYAEDDNGLEYTWTCKDQKNLIASPL